MIHNHENQIRMQVEVSISNDFYLHEKNDGFYKILLMKASYNIHYSSTSRHFFIEFYF